MASENQLKLNHAKADPEANHFPPPGYIRYTRESAFCYWHARVDVYKHHAPNVSYGYQEKKK